MTTATESGSDAAWLQTNINNEPNPAYDFSSGTAIASSGIPSASLPTGIVGSVNVGTASTPPFISTSSSSLSAYLPWLVLGIGGIALVSVMKKR